MKGDICEVDNCNKTVRTGKVCEVHGWRMRTYGSYDKPSRKRFSNVCRVEGCDKLRDGRHSVCGMHRSRLSRHKSLDIPIFNYPDGIVHECNIHGMLKPDDAYKNPKDNHYSCIKCRRENDKRFYKNHPEINSEHYKTNYYVKHKTDKVKLSKKDYEDILKKQNYVCALCKKTETAKSINGNIKRLSIDHKHGTSIVRDLLCQSCNLKRK